MNEIQLPPLADANGDARPNVLMHGVLLFEKQASGLYLPQWQEGKAGSAHVAITSGSLFAPTYYSGILNVNTEAGSDSITDAIATGARKLRFFMLGEPDTALPANAALWIAFGTDAADAAGNVNATAGSQTGMPMTADVAIGDDPYMVEIPPTFQNIDAYVALAITGADGTHTADIAITQGV